VKLSIDDQDMGLRYFDRVVVVSAGRFTEMEAHDGPWIGITDVPQEIPREFSGQK
jgi:hypothetical protein